MIVAKHESRGIPRRRRRKMDRFDASNSSDVMAGPSRPSLPTQRSGDSVRSTHSASSAGRSRRRKRVSSRGEILVELPDDLDSGLAPVAREDDPQRGLGSRANPIDLTSPRPRSHRRPRLNRAQFSDSSSSSIVLPRWQPDEEATHCVVCGTQFNLLFRRHHCRKCGRVVCGNCSQHRIRIPQKYVVEPPELRLRTDTESATPNRGGLHSEDVDVERSSASVVVRVCNPCVPDPNLSPPPQQQSFDFGVPPPQYDRESFRTTSHTYAEPRPIASPIRGGRNAASDQNLGTSSSASSRHTPRVSSIGRLPSLGDAIRGYWASQPQSQSSTSPPAYRDSGVQQASVSPQARPRANITHERGSPEQTAESRHRSSVGSRPHRCPICRQRIPGSSSERHAHVEQCFHAHANGSETTNAAQPGSLPAPPIRPEAASTLPRYLGPTTGGTQNHRHSTPIIAPVAREPALSSSPFARFSFLSGRPRASSTTPASTITPPHSSLAPFGAQDPTAGLDFGRILPRAFGQPSPFARAQAEAAPPPRPPSSGSDRMIKFKASEKDCVAYEDQGNDSAGDSSGLSPSAAANRQECVICLEDFEVGESLARLECLCKFHEKCIKDWWQTTGKSGDEKCCPTHKLNE